MTTGSAPSRAASEHAVSFPALALWLTLIAMLAFVLPFGIVRALHARRLERVAADISALAAGLGVDARGGVARVAPGIDVLIGDGIRPATGDPRWTNGITFPLSRVVSPGGPGSPGSNVPPDPWGNAYVVNAGAWSTPGADVWVLSAGPDGRLETPFMSPVSGAGPAGDDRGVRLR